MERLFQELATYCGTSAVNCALIVGLVLGFALGKTVKVSARVNLSGSVSPLADAGQEEHGHGAAVHKIHLSLDASLLQEITSLIRSGNKVDAIKRVRDEKDLGLNEAKLIVDAISTRIERQ